MHMKSTLFYLVLQSIHHVEPTTIVHHLGCHKVLTPPKGCSITPSDEQQKYSNKISTSLANGVQWIREQQKNNKWLDTPTSSWILQSLVLTGYVTDGGICTKTFNDVITYISTSLDDVTRLSGGKLALVIIGLKVSCKDAKTVKGRNLIKILKQKMMAFPKGEFNNFYQFSLGVIALYVNGEDVLDMFGERILREVLIGKNITNHHHKKRLDPNHMSDTEALSIIALSAITKQKFMSHWVRKHARREIKKADKKIDRIMKTTKLDNLVTVVHMVQVLRSNAIDISTKPFCKKTYDWILGKQDKHGSFGGLVSTSTVLALLSERSILELRNLKCPVEKDNVDNKKIDEFIKSKRTHKGKPSPRKKKVLITVQVAFDIQELNKVNKKAKLYIQEGSTALRALREASKQNSCFQYIAKDTAWGPFIEKICHVEQNNSKRTYWMFFVNGKMASTGPGSYKVKRNDVIEFKYRRV